MSPITFVVLLSLVVFGGMLVFLEIGFRIGRRRVARDPDSARAGAGVVEAAVFALLGLLLAFAFSAAQQRLDTRRDMLVKEANAIGTAYLRIDLLPAEVQPPMRELFRKYTDTRIAAYQRMPDVAASEVARAEATRLQGEIWQLTVGAFPHDKQTPAATLLIPALNDMIDITMSRSVAQRTHMPMLILVLLASLSLVSGLVAGIAMSSAPKRQLLHHFIYAFTIAITFYTIVDLEFPSIGLIRTGAAESAMVETRAGMK